MEVLHPHICDGFVVVIGFFLCAKTYLDLGCLSGMRASASAPRSGWPSTSTPHSSNAPFIFKLFLSNPLCSWHTEHMLMQTETRNDGQFNIIKYEITPLPCRAVSIKSALGLFFLGSLWKASCCPCSLFPDRDGFMVIHGHTPTIPSMWKDRDMPF